MVLIGIPLSSRAWRGSWADGRHNSAASCPPPTPIPREACPERSRRARNDTSSPLPRDRRAQHNGIAIELLARVKLRHGDEEVVLVAAIELPERNAAEDFLVLEVEENLAR